MPMTIKESSSCWVADMCEIASSKTPQEWPLEILLPFHKNVVGIFGYNHVAMGCDYKINILDALVFCLLADSKNDARRMIKTKAVRLNGEKIMDEKRILTKEDVLSNLDAIVLESGRKNYGIIELCP